MPTAHILKRLRHAALAGIAVVLALVAFATWRGPQPTILETGQAAVGGNFTLTDHKGQRRTERDFFGQNMIVYFGWTRDPDLTPAALQVLKAALAQRRLSIQPIFISLDPGHDTPSVLATFVERITPGLVGLTGDPEQITAITQAYKFYYKTIEDQTLPGRYSIDHASLYYVMGPDGQFLAAVPYTTDAAALAHDLTQAIQTAPRKAR
jgi:protein SCO1